ncbi:MAG: hypothetical protein UHS51_07490, partial [Atopobiaceae bacterium]|nr:hypothetical protein [Atopobiaceae bacterium]
GTGMPTIAVAVADNQRANVAGLERMGLGLAATWDTLSCRIRSLCGNRDLRERLSVAGSSAVDGRGSHRIASHIMYRR